jgi:hypothetical protein
MVWVTFPQESGQIKASPQGTSPFLSDLRETCSLLTSISDFYGLRPHHHGCFRGICWKFAQLAQVSRHSDWLLWTRACPAFGHDQALCRARFQSPDAKHCTSFFALAIAYAWNEPGGYVAIIYSVLEWVARAKIASRVSSWTFQHSSLSTSTIWLLTSSAPSCYFSTPFLIIHCPHDKTSR